MLKLRIAALVAVYVVPLVIMIVLFGLVLGAGIPLMLASPHADASLAAGRVPPAYRSMIISAGRRCPEVSPALVAAQLKQESGFDPAAVNETTGARGIAQFVADSWRQWGKDYDADGRADPLDPADAIGSEADYLCAIAAQLADWLARGVVHGDKTALMLAAYNAGPAAVRAAGGIPQIAETLGYIQSVRAAMTDFTTPGAATAPGVVGVGWADPVSPAAVRAIAAARAELGKPYVFGSAGPDSWDCSSLVQHAWLVAGVQISRTTYTQVESPQLRRIPYSQRRPGDLIYFRMAGPAGPYDHVGLIIDAETMIEAPRTGLTVRYQRYADGYYRSRSPMIMRVLVG